MKPLITQELYKLRSTPWEVQVLALCLALAALHSVLMGLFIYFFTEHFYRIIFQDELENLFFVRQAGLFLICLFLFYAAPLFDLKRWHPLVLVVILTKVFAFLFLLLNAHLTSVPTIIFLASALDGAMALLLALLYRRALPFLKRIV